MLELNDVQIQVLHRPERLLTLLANTPFCRGLPKSSILQDPKAARIFKMVVTHEMVKETVFDKELHLTLEKIWRNGWLHAENAANTTYFTFASSMHRW